jgi:hypothetical protein
MDAEKRKSTVAERFGAANNRHQPDRGPVAVLEERERFHLGRGG